MKPVSSSFSFHPSSFLFTHFPSIYSLSFLFKPFFHPSFPSSSVAALGFPPGGHGGAEKPDRGANCQVLPKLRMLNLRATKGWWYPLRFFRCHTFCFLNRILTF